MDETISYDYLWQAYQKEKQTNQLLLLSKTFYEDVSQFAAEHNSKPGNQTRENAIKLLADFFEKRKQKILIYVAYGRQLPQPISNTELEFYNKVLQAFKSEKLSFGKAPNTKPIFRSTRDVPEIILPSGNKFGPVRKDEKIEINNNQDEAYLLENSICEQVN